MLDGSNNFEVIRNDPFEVINEAKFEFAIKKYNEKDYERAFSNFYDIVNELQFSIYKAGSIRMLLKIYNINQFPVSDKYISKYDFFEKAFKICKGIIKDKNISSEAFAETYLAMADIFYYKNLENTNVKIDDEDALMAYKFYRTVISMQPRLDNFKSIAYFRIANMLYLNKIKLPDFKNNKLGAYSYYNMVINITNAEPNLKFESKFEIAEMLKRLEISFKDLNSSKNNRVGYTDNYLAAYKIYSEIVNTVQVDENLKAMCILEMADMLRKNKVKLIRNTLREATYDSKTNSERQDKLSNISQAYKFYEEVVHMNGIDKKILGHAEYGLGCMYNDKQLSINTDIDKSQERAIYHFKRANSYGIKLSKSEVDLIKMESSENNNLKNVDRINSNKDQSSGVQL